MINNAGGILTDRAVFSQGLEKTFTGNYLGPLLLTLLLTDYLKRSASSRIINVTSLAHRYGKIDFEDLQGSKNYNFRKAYGQAKLAQLLSTFEMAECFKEYNITVNALHPGAASTGFENNYTGLQKKIAKLVFALVGTDPEKPAETIVELAASPRYEKITGDFFYDHKKVKPAKFAQDINNRKKLWHESIKILKKIRIFDRLMLQQSHCPPPSTKYSISNK